MLFRNGFISNSSSASFIVKYPRNNFFDDTKNNELTSLLFVDNIPNSLKEFILNYFRDNVKGIDEYYYNNKFLTYSNLKEDELKDNIEIIIDRDNSSIYYTIDDLLKKYPWDFLKQDALKVEYE